MGAIIDNIIPPASFELVRDRLGEILAVEFKRQFMLSGLYYINIQVWVERFVPFDKSEMPAINVVLADGKYDNQDVRQADGTYNFYIECYANAASMPGDKRGDVEAMRRLHRILAIARGIIQSPKYLNLGFKVPKVMRRQIESLTIAQPDANDGLASCMGRLVLNVRVPEIGELMKACDIDGWETSVKLEETDKGYRYIGNTV
jgi:hypothetical protein